MVELGVWYELLKQVIHWLTSRMLAQGRHTDQLVVLKVSRAYGLPDATLVKILHELF